jgi:hypothetical protein
MHTTWLSAFLGLSIASVACGQKAPAPGADAGPPSDSAAERAAADDRAGVTDDRAGMPDVSSVHGAPGCGFALAAFCETFDAPASTQGRAGELDARQWSAGRLAAQLPTGNGCAIGIGPSTLPACRSGLPSQVYPDQDALICEPSANIASPHLLVAAAAQNYGQSSYRIRQPFDFAGRTGTIVFDAEGYTSALLGWISIDVTEDPINAPSFAVGKPGIYNDEGSLAPRSGFSIQFSNNCGGYAPPPSFSMRMLNVFQDYVDTATTPPDPPVCLPTQQGKLNHFEISISQNRIDVRATPFSADGVHFDAPKLLYSASVRLPFARGYVQIGTHNHATLKYSQGAVDAWIARWDNVGFDGPIVSNWREYEVADSLIAGTNAWNRSGPVVNIGYRVADESQGPAQTLNLRGVHLDNVATARLSISSYYLNDPGLPVASYVLKYRFNRRPWTSRPLSSAELAFSDRQELAGDAWSDHRCRPLGALGGRQHARVRDQWRAPELPACRRQYRSGPDHELARFSVAWTVDARGKKRAREGAGAPSGVNRERSEREGACPLRTNLARVARAAGRRRRVCVPRKRKAR